MISFEDVHEMRRWMVQLIGDGWGGVGPELAEIVNKLPNRPPYKTDWTEFLKSLPPHPEDLVYEKRHLAKPKKDYIALLQMPEQKNQVLGMMRERDKNDCFKEVYKQFPQLVQGQSIILIKTKSELTASEKKQLQNLK